MRHNSEWLAAMELPEILGHAQHGTVAQLLERGDFAARHAGGRPIALSEFLHPVLQAIDSLAVRADAEIGGNNQFFNLVMRRDVQRAAGHASQVVLTMPLLEGLDGVQKMGKSAGNAVWLTEPAPSKFGEIMSIPDTLVERYALLCTDMDPVAARALGAAAQAGGPPAAATKRRVGAAIVALHHGAAAVDAEDFDRRFRRHEEPAAVPVLALPVGHPVSLPRLLVDAGFARSAKEVRRLIDGGGVRLDGAVLGGGDYTRNRDELVGRVIAVGRRHVVRLTG